MRSRVGLSRRGRLRWDGWEVVEETRLLPVKKRYSRLDSNLTSAECNTTIIARLSASTFFLFWLLAPLHLKDPISLKSSPREEYVLDGFQSDHPLIM